MISAKEIAECIADILKDCEFNDDVNGNSGFHGIKEFEDGTERGIDVYKSTNGGYPHYVIYCSFEDEQFDYVFTDDLSVESLTKKLEELCA